jgi:ribosomal protein L11 methyltransferase
VPHPAPGRFPVKGRARRRPKPKPRALWKISVATSPGAEDAVAEWLERGLGQPAVSFTDAETGVTTVTAYFPERPDWSRARRASLKAALAQLRQCGLNTGAGRCALAKVLAEDWAESWKRHFRPLEVGAALLLKPSWSRRQPREGQAVVRLDPGLSFGTGQHPTTAFCLEQIVARRRPATGQPFLDVGTGSGVLAIAAAKLGYSPVHGFDVDPDAVRVACENARRNRVAGRIRFFRQDLSTLPLRSARTYAVVCANLVSPLLLSQRRRILARVRPGGVLVLAGVLKSEFRQVQTAYAASGLRLIASRSVGQWRSGAFTMQARFLSPKTASRRKLLPA